MNDKITTENGAEDFKTAVENNEYAEIEVSNGVVCIVDVDSYPYVLITDESKHYNGDPSVSVFLEEYLTDIEVFEKVIDIMENGEPLYYDEQNSEPLSGIIFG